MRYKEKKRKQLLQVVCTILLESSIWCIDAEVRLAKL
jgi:hypothetical protein